MTEFERDFTMLSDIFPTGYHGAVLAGVSPGDTVVVFGAGPVGLLAAHSSYLRGASQVYVVDLHTGPAGPRRPVRRHPGQPRRR